MNAPAPISDTAKALFDCLSDVWWRLDNLYYIENEDGEKVKFKLRTIQKLFFMIMWFRNIILKARQLGFTTAIDIYILDRALFNSNTKCGIIAHTKDDVKAIFATKIKFAYDNLPADIKVIITSTTDRENEIKFSNGSSVRVAVSMRSGTLQCLHISEYGKLWARFPEKAIEVKTGSLPTVHENGFIWIESTAEGLGGHFHELCVTSKRLADQGQELTKLDYKFNFFPWWDDAKYELDCPEGYEFSRKHREYFESLEKSINKPLCLRKRFWYVKKEEEQGDMMKQEYPSTPNEAFLFSGRKAFNANHLNAAEALCYEPSFIGEISVVNGALEEVAEGELLIWDMPDPNEQYAIGADVAEGLEHGDYSSADVLDSWGQQVAHWNGHIEPDLFGQVLFQLGKLYNFAYLGVERNNHGHTVLAKLKDLNYPNLYVQVKIDEKNDKKTTKLGWHTNQATKPFIIDNLKPLFREEEAGVRNKATIDECHTYVVDDKGRYNAQQGCFDDRVMSLAISHEMLRVMPRTPIGEQKVERVQRDWRTA